MVATVELIKSRKHLEGVITFESGQAITAGSYQVGRNADGTNLMQYNAPSGAWHEFSVNDAEVGRVTSATGSGFAVPDDRGFTVGTNRDGVFAHVNSGLSADQEATNIIVGTSDHQATSANTVILSNVTADGDIIVLVADSAGNSLEAALIDASAETFTVGFGLSGVISLLGGGVDVGSPATSAAAQGDMAVAGDITVEDRAAFGADASPTDTNIVTVDEQRTSVSTTVYGVRIDHEVSETSAANGNVIMGAYGGVTVLASNTENWTSSLGLRALGAFITATGPASGSYTVTGAAGVYVGADVGTNATISNLYGLYFWDISGAGTVTAAFVAGFGAAAGTHPMVDGSSTKTSPGSVDAWLKMDVNGTTYYVPAYTSKTS